ncbi:MAG: hypothetical protein ONB42_15685 [candidate division KSB1 bacterium]|nr:hypothetical protein [candidate division KSB1 bacterium]MDZ7311218.1 hypothetical protein [candidate division KSB1 bacterium]
MPKANKTPTSQEVDDYIASFPKPVRAALQQLRQQIRKLAPEAQEQFSYRSLASNTMACWWLLAPRKINAAFTHAMPLF